ncbi:uncharacterized protein LOC120426056 [Culex pipiens pallens]|uniref:uncharacterized protein LOC120426056 n=1 Tax=Culex pipiens pallens TaxID=42434 RepID=UPI001953CD3D|nr:uncharacterized protein LOC120426056 [Culex pipiens pallens]
MRHPELSLRAPEATSAARAQGFNKVAVDQFYDIVEAALSTGKFRKPSQFKNVDETCVVTVQSKRSKILALKGRRQVGAITSAERGVLSTACISSSACGQYLPPMLIFPRCRITEHLKRGAPPGTVFAGNPTGWMTVDIFIKWFDHFLAHTKPSAEDPVILFLDGHASHTKNLAFIEKARANHVTVISFPPHSSHKLQPLDVSFMGPLKTNFSQVIERYLKANPGKAVTINDVSELLGDAYLRSATPKNAIVGFDKTGLWPFNRHNFKLEDFAAAKATDVLDSFETDQEKPSCPPPVPVEPTPGQHPVPAEPSSKQSLLSPVEPISGQPPVPVEPTSGQSLVSPGELTPGRQGFTVSPEAIKPLPKVAGRKIASGRRRQKATELTSDTYRNALKASEANKEVSEIRKSKKRLAKVTSETSTKKKKRDGKAGKENVNDSLCAICGAVFSNFNDGSDWEKCHTCAEWFHCCVDNSCPTCNV